MTKSDNKRTFLFPTAYLPPVEFFAILTANRILLEKEETFVKQTYRNRCYIYSEKGKEALTIPLKKPAGNHTKTTGVEMVNSDKWYLRHRRAIETAYNSSPFFLYYKDDLMPFFDGKHSSLFEYNLSLINLISELIGLKPDISFTDVYIKEYDGRVTDLRMRFSPKKPPVLKTFPVYYQVFSDKHSFIPNLSIIDLLFNMGPETKSYLEELCRINGFNEP
jgi:hypothetical protein